MKLTLSPRSRRRLREIRDHIARDDPAAALRVLDRIRRSAEMLTTHPRLGWPWEGGPTRALRVPGLPYRLHYRVDEAKGEVELITVAHLRQLPPRIGS